MGVKRNAIFLGIFLTLLFYHAVARPKPAAFLITADSVLFAKRDSEKVIPQIDLKDVFKKLFALSTRLIPKLSRGNGVVVHPLVYPVLHEDSVVKNPDRVLFAPFPAIGYTLQTGITAILAMNLSFYTSKNDGTNLSSIALNPAASLSYPQFLVPLIFNVWSKENKFNFTGDFRYYKYPTYTYGLGGHSSLSDADLVNYSYIRIYQTTLKQIAASKFYAGVGYNLDYHFDIKDEGAGKDFEAYNGSATKTVSSGLSLNMQYDSRKNINYPEDATYANASYRYNSTLLGSNQNWESLYLEFKKFINLSKTSHNVLAFWSFNWFTFGGKPPYFDLPSTGWDSYSNSGRGYIQGRLRGPSMLYLETEYRFGITKNGLLGGVVFVNAQSVSEWGSGKFETVLPGTGVGLRMKINKFSGANLAIDYGFGTQGSRGLFFNICEIF
jgi:hypothetical protein